MKDLTITVKNPGGLTSRSAAELVEEANHYHSHISLKIETGEECDLKSIMNVFALPLISPESKIVIICDGDDEDQAVLGFEKLSKTFKF